VLGLGLAWAAGALLARRLWPARDAPAVLLAVLAWPAGLALTSSAYFLWMVVSGGRAGWYPWLELAGVGAALGFAWARRTRGARWVLPSWPETGVERAALVVVALVLACALLVVLRTTAVTPWGYWDAWARINFKARFLAAGGPEWTWIFRGDGVPHPQYPLLLECSVARLARWSGSSGGFDPMPARVLSVLGWLGCFASVLALVGHLCSPFLAAVAGLMLLCNRTDILWAPMQYSDFALATLLTWSVGLLVLATRAGADPWWPLVGFCVGSAAWCKDEGLAFAALVSALALCAWIRARRRSFWGPAAWIGGLALGGAPVLVLKLGFASESFLFGARERSVWQDLTDPARYGILFDKVLEHLELHMAGWTLLVLAVVLFLLPRERVVRRSWLPLGLCAAMGLLYGVVLITTRFDLDWHLSTVMNRLALHLWPVATLATMMVVCADGAAAPGLSASTLPENG